ncbi:MAG TPA: ABC transporter permease [Virgibacillus sp.]|nr:ABC transporter permease [Virgibacillus sp.]
MKGIIRTRLIHWKKHWFNLLFWALFPIFATLIIISITNSIQDDARIPVGIVLEKETPLALELYQSIEDTPFMRVYRLDESTAIDQLTKHELDSVFVIDKDYDHKVRKESRNQLITSYQSDLSFAFTPVYEMIISYAQQDLGRSKSAYIVEHLREQFGNDQQWTWDEIIAKSHSIQEEQSLLHTTFSFANAETAEDEQITVFNTWSLWALFALLSTFLLFDWVIKESRVQMMPRYSFMCVSYKGYILRNFMIYAVCLLCIDLLTVITFYYAIDEPITSSLLGAIFFYRFMISMGALLLALPFKHAYLFYTVSFALTLMITIGSGAIVPIEGIETRLSWISLINPLHAFLSMKKLNIWLPLFMILLTIWYARKENTNA